WISPTCSKVNKDCSSAKTEGKTTSRLRSLVTRSPSDQRRSGSPSWSKRQRLQDRSRGLSQKSATRLSWLNFVGALGKPAIEKTAKKSGPLARTINAGTWLTFWGSSGSGEPLQTKPRWGNSPRLSVLSRGVTASQPRKLSGRPQPPFLFFFF